jgi:hypothetical protein
MKFNNFNVLPILFFLYLNKKMTLEILADSRHELYRLRQKNIKVFKIK